MPKSRSQNTPRPETPREQEQRFARTKQIWTDITDKALSIRGEEREFHGLQGELRRYGLSIKEQYNNSRAIKHVRDLGAHREEILRIFLQESGLIPHRYGIASTSSRVVSPTGHTSNELDLVFFDKADNIILRKFGRTLEFYPIDTVLGTIQVKSKLTYRELESAFENVRSFKKLFSEREKEGGRTDGARGFGMIFAYESDLTHSQIVERIMTLLPQYRPEHLPNSIVVLGGSILRFGDRTGGYLLNNRLDLIETPTVWGDTDIVGDDFYRFYQELLALLRARRTSEVDLTKYLDLPFIAGDLSYRFALGTAAETAKCPKHGPYRNRFRPEALKEIFDSIKTTGPIQWLKAWDLARGLPGDNEASYQRQPGSVRIYNPRNWPLDKILFSEEGFIIYDDLVIEGISVWVPLIYGVEKPFYLPCPECNKSEARNKRPRRRAKFGISQQEATSEEVTPTAPAAPAQVQGGRQAEHNQLEETGGAKKSAEAGMGAEEGR